MPPPPAFFIVALFFTFCCFFFSFLMIRRRTGSPNLPPGSTGWPILGETLPFLRASRTGNPESFVEERLLKYESPVFRTSLVGHDVAVFPGTQGNKFLFGNENKLVALWWPPSIQRLFGRCLINSTGDEAKRQRKLFLAFLAPEALLRYVEVMDEVTRHHFSTLWRGRTEEVIEVYPRVKLYAFQLACRLFMSMEEPEQVRKLAARYEVFEKGMLQIPVSFPGTRYYEAKKAVAGIREELWSAARERREALAQGRASPSQDLLSHLLATADEEGRLLSEEEVVNNVLTLLFAGHDTAASAMTMLVKHLGESPDVYETVLQEQLCIARSKAPGELLRWEDAQKMRVSWNVACEVMRLTPPVTGSFRVALADFTYGGYTIPKGWKLFWSTTTHRDPRLFRMPEKFDPGRFEAGVAPFAYTPFGGGARMCVGREFARLQILVFMHNLVKEFRWDVVVPGEAIKYDPMPAPQSGLPIRLHLLHPTATG